jgi:hypothetical protein
MKREQWMWMRASVALMAAAAAAMKHASHGSTVAEDMPTLSEPIAGQ